MAKKQTLKVTENRAAILASARFKKAHAAALERRGNDRCKHGHSLADPVNVHVGYLFRMKGKGLLCRVCWEKQQAAYLAKKEAK